MILLKMIVKVKKHVRRNNLTFIYFNKIHFLRWRNSVPVTINTLYNNEVLINIKNLLSFTKIAKNFYTYGLPILHYDLTGRNRRALK
jgi:hypothetical protein